MSQFSPDQIIAEKLMWGRMCQSPDLIVNLLERLGAQGVELGRGQVRCTCPIHKGSNPKNFVVWYDRGAPVWKCLSRGCGNGGPITRLPNALWGITIPESLNFLCGLCGIPVMGATSTVSDDLLDSILARNGVVCQMTNPVVQQYQELEIFPEYMVEQSMHYRHDYWVKRSYDTNTLARFQIGFVPSRTWWFPSRKNPGKMRGWQEDRTSIPIRMRDGRLIGFAGRRVDGIDFLKYQTLEGTLKTETLYGSHCPEIVRAIHQTRHLIIVEGYSDVWRAHQFGVYNTLALMGTDLSPAQKAEIEGFAPQRITIYLDNDIAGREQASLLQEQLFTLAPIDCAFNPAGDPGDSLTRASFLQPLGLAA